MALKDQLGTFSWFSLMTSDVREATKFYKNLLGWTSTEFEIPGHGASEIYVAAGKTFGNPVQLGDDETMPGHWIPYIAVDNVDSSCEKSGRLGGKVVVPAFDIPSIGRTAVITDPVGAAFHIYTPDDKSADMKMTGNEPGQVCWLELMINNPDAVIPYYGEMFGWKISEPMDMNGGSYQSLEICGDKLGGIMKRPPQVPETPPAWLAYMCVESVDKANKKAVSLGGKVVMPKTEIPDTGYFSLIQDPTGAFFYSFEFKG